MLNVTKKLKLFVLYAELSNVTLIRRFIAIIALFIFSALSAWAAPMQVNSPEGPYDCKSVASGRTVKTDCGCGQPASSTYACLKCGDNTSCLGCDRVPFSGKVWTDCGCGAPASSSYACRRCGDNTSCLGCDGVPFSGKTIVCGTCGGAPAASFACKKCNDNTSCRGCDGVPFSGKVNQGCGCDKGSPSSFGSCVAFKSKGAQDGGAGIHILIGSGRSGNYSEKHCVFGAGTSLTFCGRHRPTGKGCFDPDTELLLEGGRTVKARNVRVGDRLYNPLTRSSAAVTEIISGPETEAMIEVGFKGYMLKVTRLHPVLTTAGMKRAANLTTKDVVLDALGAEQIVQYVQQAPILPNQKVINFTLDSDSADYRHRLLVGNNVVSGDLVVQNGHLEGE